jgi:hypothetical protein
LLSATHPLTSFSPSVPRKQVARTTAFVVRVLSARDGAIIFVRADRGAFSRGKDADRKTGGPRYLLWSVTGCCCFLPGQLAGRAFVAPTFRSAGGVLT